MIYERMVHGNIVELYDAMQIQLEKIKQLQAGGVDQAELDKQWELYSQLQTKLQIQKLLLNPRAFQYAFDQTVKHLQRQNKSDKEILEFIKQEMKNKGIDYE